MPIVAQNPSVLPCWPITSPFTIPILYFPIMDFPILLPEVQRAGWWGGNIQGLVHNVNKQCLDRNRTSLFWRYGPRSVLCTVVVEYTRDTTDILMECQF